MATLAKQPKFQPLDALGNPYPDYALYSYAAGTSTLKVTYKDKNNTPNTNPVILDAGGYADVWLQGSYKLVLRPPVANPDQTPIWTVDNIEEYNNLDWTGLTATIAMLNATDTSTKTLYANYDVILSDRGKTLLCDTTSTAFQIQLPNATVATNGYVISLKKVSIAANAVTIKPFTAQTIDGLTQLLLTNKDESITIICDGSNWRILQDTVKVKVQPIVTDNTLGNLVTLVPFPPRYFYRIQPSTSDITILLPSLANIGDGFELIFKKVGGSTYSGIITPFGTEKIDDVNASIFLHTSYESITLLSTSVGWYKTSDSAGLITGDPIGSYLLTSVNAASLLPTYMSCDGSAISRTAYSEYFALVGTSYGAGDGFTTFNIPSALDRVIASSGPTFGFATHIGTSTEILSLAQIPPHTHQYNSPEIVYPATEGVEGGGGSTAKNFHPASVTQPSGGGYGHNNIQQTLVGRIFVKVK
jgi:microcystin-dependent protein